MFWKTALALSMFLAVTVLPCHADHDHDDNRPADEYSGHDGQTTLPDPNDIGTPSFNEIRSSLDQQTTYTDSPDYLSSAPENLSQTPPVDFSKIKTPTVHLTFEENSEDYENQSKELQEYKKSFTSMLNRDIGRIRDTFYLESAS